LPHNDFIDVSSVGHSGTCFTVPHSRMAEHFVEILLLPDSPIIPVFRHRGLLLNFDGFIRNEGTEYKGDEKIGRFLTNKLVYLGNGPSAGSRRRAHC